MNVDDAIRLAPPVGPERMREAREAHEKRQRALLARRNGALLSFTLNIPGEYKNYPLAQQAFAEGCRIIEGRLARAGLPVTHREEARPDTGCEGYWLVDAPAEAIKKIAVAVEDSHPLGRVWDFDVLDTEGRALRGEDAGRGQRQCIVCGKPVWECARDRAHPPEELSRRTALLLREFFDTAFADTVAALATRALLYEVNVTPKPGLVDRDNQGAHRDMDIFTFIDSSVALTPFFRDIAVQALRFTGDTGDLLPLLRLPGQWAEDRMYAATEGVNTHKGLIFSLGILCAGLGVVRGKGLPATVDSLLNVCAAMAGSTPGEMSAAPSGGEDTHGRRVFRRFGVTGARGEAAQGFPHLRECGHPVLERFVREGNSLNDAGVAALLHLLARVDDTNIIARSDYQTLLAVRGEVAAFLDRNPDIPAIKEFAATLDARFRADWLSPGGCADLLVLAFMLHFSLQAGLLNPA